MISSILTVLEEKKDKIQFQEFYKILKDSVEPLETYLSNRIKDYRPSSHLKSHVLDVASRLTRASERLNEALLFWHEIKDLEATLYNSIMQIDQAEKILAIFDSDSYKNKKDCQLTLINWISQRNSELKIAADDTGNTSSTEKLLSQLTSIQASDNIKINDALVSKHGTEKKLINSIYEAENLYNIVLKNTLENTKKFMGENGHGLNYAHRYRLARDLFCDDIAEAIAELSAAYKGMELLGFQNSCAIPKPDSKNPEILHDLLRCCRKAIVLWEERDAREETFTLTIPIFKTSVDPIYDTGQGGRPLIFQNGDVGLNSIIANSSSNITFNLGENYFSGRGIQNVRLLGFDVRYLLLSTQSLGFKLLRETLANPAPNEPDKFIYPSVPLGSFNAIMTLPQRLVDTGNYELAKIPFSIGPYSSTPPEASIVSSGSFINQSPIGKYSLHIDANNGDGWSSSNIQQLIVLLKVSATIN